MSAEIRGAAAAAPVRSADALVLGLAAIFAAGVRYFCRDYSTVDFDNYTSLWYAAIKSSGFAALGTGVSNYTPPYLYLLYLTSVVLPHVQPVFAVKIPSIAFDYVCAWFVYKIVRLKYATSAVPLYAFIAVLLAPTVVANSALWGQADSLYAAMLLACVYCLMTRRPARAMLAFGVAFSIKLQTVFLAPALAAFWLRRIVPFWTFLLVPLVYALMMVPAALAGRPAAELAGIYLAQGETYEFLNRSAPNLYAWTPERYYHPIVFVGMLLAVAMALLYVWRIWRSRTELGPELILKLCLLSSILVPFFLPKMHERYFFAADLLAIAYAFYFPSEYFVAVLVSFASFFAYSGFLFRTWRGDDNHLRILSLVMCAALVAVARSSARSLRTAARP